MPIHRVGVLTLVLLAGCLQVVLNGVADRRAAAGVPALRVEPSLVEAARASAARMCAAGVAGPAPNPLTAYGEPTTTAVDELAGSALLDPALATPLDRANAATNAVWAG